MATVLIISPVDDVSYRDVVDGLAPPDCGTVEQRRSVARTAAAAHADLVAERCRQAPDAPWDEVQIMEPHEVATWRSLHPRDIVLQGGDLDGYWSDWLDAAADDAWQDVDIQAALDEAGIRRYASIDALARDVAAEYRCEVGERLVSMAADYAMRRWQGWTPDWDVLQRLRGDLEVVSRLVTAEMIADRAGVTTNTVHVWRRRHQGFPPPLAELGQLLVWRWEDVEPWLAVERRPGRPRRGG